jgi:hypothetical protein
MPFDPSAKNQKIIDGVVVLSEFDADALGNPPIDKTFLYAEDDGLGNTVLKTKNSSGTEKTISMESASLICETRPSDPSTYLLTSPANNIIAFNTATGSNPSVYDQSSGVFTLPANGVYALSVAMIIDSIDELAFEYAGVTLLVNGNAIYSFPDGVLSPPPYPRAVVIGTVMFEGLVGAEIQLNVYLVDSGSTDGGNLIDVPYSNYISLFKL